jgi:hypothetical protein
MKSLLFAVLRSPDPLGYRAAKKLNNACLASAECTSFGQLLTCTGRFSPFWSGVVRVESIHPDQKTRAMTGLVRVVRVVRAKFNIIHMRARAYVSLFFLHIIHFVRLKFEFVRNHPDHPDQPSHSAACRPDHPPGPPRTTRTRPVTARLSGFMTFIGGGRPSKNRPKWSDIPLKAAGFDYQSGGN